MLRDVKFLGKVIFFEVWDFMLRLFLIGVLKKLWVNVLFRRLGEQGVRHMILAFQDV